MKEEFIILLEKFLRKEITPEELTRLHQLRDESEEIDEAISSHYQHEWQRLMKPDGLLGDYQPEDEATAWSEIKRQLPSDYKKAGPFRRISWRQAAVAASIAVLFTTVGYSLQQFTRGGGGQDLVVTADNGQKAKVELPDGSVVWLNAVSRLSYSSDYNRKKRVVELTGEACFEVAKSIDKPFIVRTVDGLEIEALGTMFNVKSYTDDAHTTSTLLEGKIRISNNTMSELLLLNERVIYCRAGRSFMKDTIKHKDVVLSWMNKKLIFDEEPLSSIAKTIERMYAVKVVLASPTLNDIVYSGEIKNHSLENVLELITTVSPVEYTKKEMEIVFTPRSTTDKNR